MSEWIPGSVDGPHEVQGQQPGSLSSELALFAPFSDKTRTEFRVTYQAHTDIAKETSEPAEALRNVVGAYIRKQVRLNERWKPKPDNIIRLEYHTVMQLWRERFGEK